MVARLLLLMAIDFSLLLFPFILMVMLEGMYCLFATNFFFSI